MLVPKFLEKGDTIGIVSPARFVTEEELIPALKIIEGWGCKVKIGKYVHEKYNQFAGTDEQRAEDFQTILDDCNVKAILCSRGGYGTVRIMDKINFKIYTNNPKWVIGYSDITVLHSYINSKLEIQSLHATMAINFGKGNKESVESLKDALFGEDVSYNLPYHKLNKLGESEGVLIGGNLSVLNNILGTNYDVDTKDKILFIEDLDEYLYHIDRMMMNLKLAGKLKKLKGLVVGRMSSMRDNDIPFGKSAYEIIAESVAEYNFPVCFNFPAGHEGINLAIKMGNLVKMYVEKEEVKINYAN